VLFGNPQRIAAGISPDGQQLAWIAPHDGVLNVWVRDLRGQPGSERVITDDRDRGVHMCRWAPDGSRIFYLQDSGGDENWRLFDVHLTTGEKRDLTPYDDVQVRIVKIDKRHPDCVLLAINRDNKALHDVYRLDVACGELTKVFTNPGFIGTVADAELRIRAALAPLPDGGTVILVRDDEQQDWRPLLQVGIEDAMSTVPVTFNADGTRLLCLTSVEANATQAVWIDLATGQREVIVGDATYDVADLCLHIDTYEPLVAFVQRDRLEPVVLDPQVGEDIRLLREVDGGDLQLLGSDHANTIWLVGTVADDGPVRYYTYERTTRQTTFLFAHRPELEQYTLAPMQPFNVTARDGLTLNGYLTFPPGQPRQNLPAVLLVHGGPWVRDCWGLDTQVQWLANRGYAVVQVNYRGSAGYGKTFLNAGNRQWGAKMHDDLLDALAHTVEQGWVDPARVGIYGGSWGGYAALIGAAFTPDVFACAVDLMGPANLTTLLNAMPEYWSPLKPQVYTRVGNPDTEADHLWQRSPLSRADQIRIPVLVVQGANDPRVPIAEAEQLIAALRGNGVDHQYLLFGDEGHGLAKPGNRLRFYAAAEQFLATHLGGRAEPADDNPPAPPTTGSSPAGPEPR
jgi:dipeptidyl aminopeptidase/acylaminoacyl peptidase